MNGVMICLFEVPLAAGLRQWPVKQVLALGYILMGASFLTFLVSGSLTAFVLMMVVFTIGEMSAFSRQQAYSASLAPEDMRGRYVGFLSFAWCAGNTASSALGMPLYDHHATDSVDAECRPRHRGSRADSVQPQDYLSGFFSGSEGAAATWQNCHPLNAVLSAVIAFGLWGVLPVYWKQLGHLGSDVAWRSAWCGRWPPCCRCSCCGASGGLHEVGCGTWPC
jgi:MFS family permease